MRGFCVRILMVYCSVWLIVIGALPDAGHAALIPIDHQPAAAVAPRSADMGHIQTVLESKVVSQRLADLGFTPSQVQERLAALTDEQLHQVAQNLDGAKPGGELILILAIIGAIVVVLAIIGLARQA
jgi:hypothetical protein